MPTYEYRCPTGHEFEHFVLRISEAQSSMRCPTCGEAAERRISAGGGLLFKGSGFYRTDSRDVVVGQLIENGWIKNEYRAQLRHMLIHSIRADEVLNSLGAASKFNTDWRFLTDLRDRGRATASQWLGENFINLGKRATVDLVAEYLNPTNSCVR